MGKLWLWGNFWALSAGAVRTPNHSVGGLEAYKRGRTKRGHMTVCIIIYFENPIVQSNLEYTYRYSLRIIHQGCENDNAQNQKKDEKH